MSMNFGREQALLRQRLTAAGSEQAAATMREQHGDVATFLGAPRSEVDDAARELADAFPEMGRAQMTAFVRTIWRTKIHELRLVGVDLLARRTALLEPPDMPFVVELIAQARIDELSDRIARDVLGPLVAKHKKHWSDLQKLTRDKDARVRRAGVLGALVPLGDDGSLFDRFEKLAKPLLAAGTSEPTEVLAAVDEVLQRAAAAAREEVAAFAAEHGRKLRMPKPRAPQTASADQATKRPPAKKVAAKKVAAKKAPAKKATTNKAPTNKATGKKATGKKTTGKKATGKKAAR